MPNDAQIPPHFTEVCLLRAAKEVVIVGLERMKGCWKLGRKGNTGEQPTCVRHVELRQHARSKYKVQILGAEHKKYGAEKIQK